MAGDLVSGDVERNPSLEHIPVSYPVNWRLTTGWTVRGSNPGGSEIFRTRPDLPWGPSSLLCNGYQVFTEGKAAWAWRLAPTPTSAEVEGRVEQYLNSTFGPSCSVIG